MKYLLQSFCIVVDPVDVFSIDVLYKVVDSESELSVVFFLIGRIIGNCKDFDQKRS